MFSLLVAASAAFAGPAALGQRCVDPAMAFGKRAPASPTKPVVGGRPKPLSPGSNYPTTRNIQSQSNGFGNFVQKFQTSSTAGKTEKVSKYGVPIYTKSGAINPVYLAAERSDMMRTKKRVAPPSPLSPRLRVLRPLPVPSRTVRTRAARAAAAPAAHSAPVHA